MTITVEIKGEKKEIEAYLKTKIGMNFTKNAPKSMSKILKKEVDLTCASQESAICMSYTPQYTLSFAHYGPCKLPVKKRKRA
jgi:hypothetical protein